jgi:hypothetical protein
LATLRLAALSAFGRTMTDSDTTLIGHDYTMPTACPRCHGTRATIGTGRAMHAASIVCVCGRFRAWMCKDEYDFLEHSLKTFGHLGPLDFRLRPPKSAGGSKSAKPKLNSTGNDMPSTADFFPSNYLKASDLAGKERQVTISHIETRTFDNDTKRKPVALFSETGTKGLVLNKTNFVTLAAIHGDNSDNWAGKTITIYPDFTSYQGKPIETIRIRRATTDLAAPSKVEFNDQIPWQ